MTENKIVLLLTLVTRRRPKLAREEDVVDAVERAAKAVDAFTREW